MTTTHVQDGCIYTPPYMVYVISIAGTYVEYLTLYRVSGILYTQHLDGGHHTTHRCDRQRLDAVYSIL